MNNFHNARFVFDRNTIDSKVETCNRERVLRLEDIGGIYGKRKGEIAFSGSEEDERSMQSKDEGRRVTS